MNYCIYFFATQAATFIVLKILMQEEGLRYCCGYSERFFAVAYVFSGMVDRMDDEPSAEILKNLIPCYLRMSAAPRLVGLSLALL